jgi:hypothetical protein
MAISFRDIHFSFQIIFIRTPSIFEIEMIWKEAVVVE